MSCKLGVENMKFKHLWAVVNSKGEFVLADYRVPLFWYKKHAAQWAKMAGYKANNVIKIKSPVI